MRPLPPPSLERLEARRLLAAEDFLLLGDGTLVINGTEADDFITVDGFTRPSVLQISNVRHLGGDASGPIYELRFEQEFNPAQVQRIEIHAGAANDIVRLYTIFIPAEVFGDDGHDAITARGSDFVLHGGDGRDVLNAGNGNDRLYGDASPDIMIAGDGNDLMSGGGGGDHLHGMGGRDRLYGGEGGDAIYGESGDDRIVGQNGNDTLYGEGGYDFLSGGAGADLMFGNSGGDFFDAADGEADTLSGGADADTGQIDELLDEVASVSPVT